MKEKSHRVTSTNKDSLHSQDPQKVKYMQNEAAQKLCYILWLSVCVCVCLFCFWNAGYFHQIPIRGKSIHMFTPRPTRDEPDFALF